MLCCAPSELYLDTVVGRVKSRGPLAEPLGGSVRQPDVVPSAISRDEHLAQTRVELVLSEVDLFQLARSGGGRSASSLSANGHERILKSGRIVNREICQDTVHEVFGSNVVASNPKALA